jgi:predicted HicB family RNase H-like nuclease
VVRIHYEIDADLHRRAKAQAAYRGITLREYIEQAITAAVTADETGGTRAW